MTEIKRNGKILARHIKPSDIKPGLNFFSDDNEYIQAGVWNYGQGKDLLAHVHNTVERKIDRTCEVLYIVRGRIEARIYSLEREQLDCFSVESGDVLILLECGHGYRILEDDTLVLEVKNGPYLGAEADRERI